MLQQIEKVRRPVKRPNRYVSPHETSLLMSDAATRVADFVLQRANARRAAGQGEGSFYERYSDICGLARRKYPLPLSTVPQFRTDSPRHEVPRR